MVMSDDIPRSWHAALERKGIAPSYRAIGAAAGMSHEAARRVVRGRSVKPSSIRKVADALGVDLEVIHRLRGEDERLADVWEPPASSLLLNPDEREALNRLIALMTRGRTQESDPDGQSPMKQGAAAPAPQGRRVTARPPARQGSTPRQPPGAPGTSRP